MSVEIKQNMDNPSDFHLIFARNCEVRRIDKPTASAFLQTHHRYGNARARFCYGLFLKRYTGSSTPLFEAGTLVAVAQFSAARKWIKEGKEVRSYEWVRYSSITGVRIAGGMGKMLKTFINEQKPDDIMTYAISDWSEGDVYRKLGFVEEGIKTFGESSSIKFRLKL